MIAFAGIGSRIWALCVCSEGSVLHDERGETAYLDFQIQQWSSALPSSLRLFDPQASSLEDVSMTAALNTLLDSTVIGDHSFFIRALIYLRANELRILIHRPALYSSASIWKNPLSARTAANIAQCSVSLLLYLCRLPTLHSMHYVCATHFLASSLTVLLLAVSHAPEDLGAEVRDQILSFLSLLEDLATKTSHSERLWSAVQSYRGRVESLGSRSLQERRIRDEQITPVEDEFFTSTQETEESAIDFGPEGFLVFGWNNTPVQDWFSESQETSG